MLLDCADGADEEPVEGDSSAAEGGEGGNEIATSHNAQETHLPTSLLHDRRDLLRLRSTETSGSQWNQSVGWGSRVEPVGWNQSGGTSRVRCRLSLEEPQHGHDSRCMRRKGLVRSGFDRRRSIGSNGVDSVESANHRESANHVAPIEIGIVGNGTTGGNIQRRARTERVKRSLACLSSSCSVPA